MLTPKKTHKSKKITPKKDKFSIVEAKDRPEGVKRIVEPMEVEIEHL